jgi:hypothetical protein
LWLLSRRLEDTLTNMHYIVEDSKQECKEIFNYGSGVMKFQSLIYVLTKVFTLCFAALLSVSS